MTVQEMTLAEAARIASPADLPLRVMVKGKIVRARRYEGRFFTSIMCPAADEYSRPQVAEVRSANKIGERDEVVTVRCQLGGYERKAFEAKDKQTGEVVRIIPVEHTLELIE